VRSHLALPDSSVGAPGRDRSVDDVLAQVRLFRSLGGPGFASHVLALRASVGMARGPGADAGHFEAGGAAGSSESVSGLSLFGGSPLLFPIRGYPSASRSGRRAWSASAEYRVPLALVNRGLGAWPVHLDRLTGTLFADAGNAWGPELRIQGFQNPKRAALASVGAEVTATALALWSAPLQLRVGVGFPLVEGGGPLTYVRLGLSF
jgi:outer membrane protein assembly factor BamA